MGIPGLARRLEPYTSRYSSQELVGYVAIIDGPSLAYHAHKLALAGTAAQSKLPSYADINNAALEWLASLEEMGIKVSQILFDGALPVTKRAERLSRTEQNMRRIHQFRSNYATIACPIPTYLGSNSYAFLAPALREALASSAYALRTRIVPGEADDFCALSTKDIAHSVIFTSDTDLLLYGYHPETLIVFFHDAELLPGLKAFSPHKTRQKLNLGSLVQLAYAVTQQPSDGQEELVRDARALDLESAAYLEFSSRYTVSVSLPPYMDKFSMISEGLQTLDVRISELVHQCLEGGSIALVHLPLLMEDSNQASAWTMGQDTRTLAYSLLAPHRSVVHEYKRKAQGISPQEISPYSLTNLEIPTKELESRVSGLVQWAQTRDVTGPLLWSLFALSIVVSELNTPPHIPLVLRVLNGDFDNTWEFVQLTARLQAALYSLRILKQIISVWLEIHANAQTKLQEHIAALHKHLSSFPTIADTLTVPGQTKRVLAEHEKLKGYVEEIYASLGVELPTEQISNKTKKRRAREADRKKRKAEQRQQSRADGLNLFSELSNF